MVQRDKAKKIAVLTGSIDHWRHNHKLRNNVTKINRDSKRAYCQRRLADSGQDCKKLWNVLNEIMGRKKSVSSFIESGGVYLTKSLHIANFLMAISLTRGLEPEIK